MASAGVFSLPTPPLPHYCHDVGGHLEAHVLMTLLYTKENIKYRIKTIFFFSFYTSQTSILDFPFPIFTYSLRNVY
jgi:hypothetical protein